MAIESETGIVLFQHRWRLAVLLAIVALGLLWGGWKWWELRRYRRAMAEIEEDLGAGRNALAARNLGALLAWRPGSDEAAYFLGMCERARGRTEAAAEAWARIPPGSLFASPAIEGRITLQIERGRLADAEQLIKNAMADPRSDASGLSLLLGPVYCLQGRVEEAERVIEASWDHLAATGQGATEAAITLVRLHIELQRTGTPVEAVRTFLDQAARSAPDDERVWLGKANLAIRTGSYDEAARWLAACLRGRPDDVPVWRARLNWAMATGRVAEARLAMKHLPAAESTPAQVQKLAAWFAAQRGDAASERRSLERLITVDPTDFTALDRLAELAVKDDQPDRAVELRRKKTEIDRLEARYQELYGRYQPRRDAAEMARLAEQLGRRFEARAFLTVPALIVPERDDRRRDLARLNLRTDAIEEPGRTLADVLAPELGDDRNPAGQSTPEPVTR
ncbi:MAG: tetratricopeptide repeat protein [Isosphaerales bacterium]